LSKTGRKDGDGFFRRGRGTTTEAQTTWGFELIPKKRGRGGPEDAIKV